MKVLLTCSPLAPIAKYSKCRSKQLLHFKVKCIEARRQWQTCSSSELGREAGLPCTKARVRKGPGDGLGTESRRRSPRRAWRSRRLPHKEGTGRGCGALEESLAEPGPQSHLVRPTPSWMDSGLTRLLEESRNLEPKGQRPVPPTSPELPVVSGQPLPRL